MNLIRSASAPHTSHLHEVSRSRLIASAVVASTAAVVLIPGLIDPVEGSLPLILGGALLLLSWLIGRVRMPRLAWISWIVTFVAGVGTLTIVIARRDLASGSTGEGILSLHPAILIPLIIYELGVVATIAGAAWNATRITRHALRAKAHSSRGKVALNSRG